MIRKMDYINKTMTEIVKQYIDNGYVFSKTMSGHQGEIYKLDLEKNGNVVRFIVNEGITRKEKVQLLLLLNTNQLPIMNFIFVFHF